MPDLAFLQTSLFYELTALLALAALVGYLGLLLHQPMIVSYIATGILAGQSVLGIVHSTDSIATLAELGVVVLLFLVGLKLDLHLVRTLGGVSLATGLGQVFFTSAIGFLICLGLGLDTVTSLYIAVALTFSSTIIIVKLLSDKKEVDSLHGRIAIGFLIVQDLVVVLAMMALSAFGIGSATGGGGEESAWLRIGQVVAAGLAMLGATGLFIRYLATPLVGRIAHSPELLITFALGWAALLAALGDYLGFGKELGGLLAGVSLASTPYREAVVARLSSLRDFLLLFFFIALGSQLELGLLGAQIPSALLLSLFVLVGNPLIVLAIMGRMGYRKRTGFLAGLTVAQISEFSLIFMAMGMAMGHVDADALGLVTLVGLVTIALSVYMITWSHELYRRLEPFLGPFERKVPEREAAPAPDAPQSAYDVILFGIGRYGSAIAQRLRTKGVRLLAVDFNPDELRRWHAAGYDAVYGDACDEESVASLPLGSAAWVVSALPQHELGLTHEDPRLVLMNALKRQGYTGKVAISTQREQDVELLRSKGADLVFLPFQDAAERAVDSMCQAGLTRT
ncbi:cation:proton antiporter [Massilia sp. BSC265]|uniref:cation:proton antiporter n=1 Tax=Massilia sp. BSC265 TaxID=1549812 RepID=UPI0004E95C4E|nr:cation:proton antiporter family protein [Massilia sp. BSC265]KFI08507.1 sodium:proton exchanger [Massilia sp. BSC265]